MKGARSVAAWVLAGSVVAGCSLVLNFDRQGQPCDSRGQCLPGFRCVDRVCIAAVDNCGGCPSGQVCAPFSRRCLPNTCQYRHCPIGQSCFPDDAGFATCRAISPFELGSSCDLDSRCASLGANRVCLQSSLSLSSSSNQPRPGICVEKCFAAGASCAAAGATCRRFTLGLDSAASYFCIGDNVVLPCKSNSECADDGLVCAVFDHPAVGPTALCDAPVDGGSAAGESCRLTSDPPGAPTCANGLCLQTSAGAVCSELCGTPTCSDGKPCKAVEFAGNRIPRQIPACSSDTTACQSCSGTPQVCGADAPHCTPLGPGSRCLLACSLDAGAVTQSCPGGYRCVAQDAGTFCLPAPGPACP